MHGHGQEARHQIYGHTQEERHQMYGHTQEETQAEERGRVARSRSCRALKLNNAVMELQGL